jgi:hypothetical protein
VGSREGHRAQTTSGVAEENRPQTRSDCITAGPGFKLGEDANGKAWTWFDRSRQGLQDPFPILVTLKNGFAPAAAIHHVVNRSGILDGSLPSHAGTKNHFPSSGTAISFESFTTYITPLETSGNVG